MDTASELANVLARLGKKPGVDPSDLTTARQLTATLQAELDSLREDRRKVMAENLASKAKLSVLEQQIKLLKASGAEPAKPEDEFVEHLGAVFRRKPGGRIVDTPLCRTCRKPMKAVSEAMPYCCSKCEIFALFGPAELNDVLLTLKRR
jgi:hypothetical protein